MKVNKILYILILAITLISCEGNVFNPKINQKAEHDSLIITKFDLAMSEMMARVWAPIRVFEYHQINSPFDQEALEIKSCQSKIAAKRFVEIINDDLKNMKEEFMNDSFIYVAPGVSPIYDPILSFNSDVESKMNEHIYLLEKFLEFNSQIMATATYTQEKPIAAWENHIKNLHLNERGNPNRNFSDSMKAYRSERNRTVGPIAQIFSKYWEIVETPAMLHHMREHIKTNMNITDITDSENVDYSFWKENKDKFINNPVCS